MEMKITMIVLLTTILAGCLSGRDYQKTFHSLLKPDLLTTGGDYQVVLDSWIGFDVNLLVRRWGAPSQVFAARNGNSVYVFGRTDNLSNPVRAYKHIVSAVPELGYSTFKSKYGFSALPEYMSLTRKGPSGREVQRFSCETLVEVDEGNSITHWSYRGYDCY